MYHRRISLNSLFGFMLLSSFCLLSGCSNQTKDHYYWGSYENHIYNMYIRPDKSPPLIQIQQLSQDIQSAQLKNKPIAPGVYAHLGFMYAAVGDKSKAKEAFNKERALYPESNILIDGMLKRSELNQNKESSQ